jgi:NaMN:DMB phosphoribosyltransferase
MLNHPWITIFAGDHGVVEENISAYPQAVTRQMLQNFTTGGAAISVLAKYHEAHLQVIDCGTVGEYMNTQVLNVTVFVLGLQILLNKPQ